MPSPSKSQLNLSIDSELKETFRVLCEENNLSMAKVLETLIRRSLVDSTVLDNPSKVLVKDEEGKKILVRLAEVEQRLSKVENRISLEKSPLKQAETISHKEIEKSTIGILALNDSGPWSSAELARQLKVHPGTIARWKKNGIPERYEPLKSNLIFDDTDQKWHKSN